MTTDEDREEKGQDPGWTGRLTPVVGVVWLVTVVWWWLFWSGDMGLARKLAVALVSLLVAGGAVLAVLVPWSMRHADARGHAVWGVPGFRRRLAGTVAMVTAGLLLAAWWLWTGGSGYGWCQSLMVVGSVLLVLGLLLLLTWMRWGVPRGLRPQGR
jgi:hypothetical protein